ASNCWLCVRGSLEHSARSTAPEENRSGNVPAIEIVENTMTLSLDQSTIFTEFTQIIPVEVANVIRPHISGPQAELHRYSVAAEKALISLGTYISGSGTAYSWPDLSVG